jgi:BirA family transcriptional regulator, biotin operon repressor / biotin---[acetyl-CoA-carboxylase] ligase
MLEIMLLDYDLPALERKLTRTSYAGKLRFYPEITSTNTAAMQAAQAAAPEGSVFLADQQSAGKGRSGHEWHSEPGAAILVSVILRPRIVTAQALWLSLMAGVAVHHAISRVIGVDCDLRWPNDLLISGKKVCGILTELSSEMEQLRFAVVGIGINVNQQSFPPAIAPMATSLRQQTDKIWSRDELLVALLESLEVEYRRALSEMTVTSPEGALLQRIQAISSYVRNKQVHVDEMGGYDGITDGLDARGFLRVKTTSGVRTVISGGVRELR